MAETAVFELAEGHDLLEKDIDFQTNPKSLIENRKSELKSFAIALKNEYLINEVCSPNGSAAFGDIVRLAVQDYGVTQKELSQATSYSIPQIGRWLKNASTPHVGARKGILDAIAMLIEDDLDQ